MLDPLHCSPPRYKWASGRPPNWYWWPDTLIITRAPASKGSSVLVVNRWLWPANNTFLEVASMVVTWWIVAFLYSVCYVDRSSIEWGIYLTILSINYLQFYTYICCLGFTFLVNTSRHCSKWYTCTLIKRSRSEHLMQISNFSSANTINTIMWCFMPHLCLLMRSSCAHNFISNNKTVVKKRLIYI